METDEVTPPAGKAELSDANKVAVLNFVEFLIENLTLTRVLLIALFGALLIALNSFYEHRSTVMQWTLDTLTTQTMIEPSIKDWSLSDNSKRELNALVETGRINMIAVTEVDLKKNMRKIRYSHFKQGVMPASDTESLAKALAAPQAVFDYDPKNTEQLVAVLANEFRCDNYADTSYMKRIPMGVKYVSTLCRIAIPPFVGHFVGYLTVGLEQPPTKQELDSIRLDLSRIAIEIYLSDVVKQPQNVD